MIKTRKCNTVDDYHGTKVPDPYRWLEDPESEETKLWTKEQNELSYEYFQNIETRKDYKEKLSRLWYYTEFHVPKKINDGLLFMEKGTMDNQPKLYFEKDDNNQPKVVIDPNTFSEDGTVALSNYSMSSNGRYLAYAKSSSGSDWQNIRILDMENGKDLEEEINWCRFTNIVWNPENTGFYYGRFPNPETVSKEDQGNYNHICFHKIGTNQSEDILIYKDEADKELSFFPNITEDDRYLVLHVGRGTSPKNGFYYKDLRDDSEFVKLLNEGESQYNFIGNKDSLFYFKTDNRASKGRIIAVDISKPKRSNWKEIIPESENIIDRVHIIGNKLVVVYMHDVKHKIKVFNINGDFQYDINLHIIGTITEITGKEKDSEMYFGLMSFTEPTSIYKFNVDTKELQIINKTNIDFEGSEYETKQIFYKSKDGTKVPMFIIHKKGIKLDSNNHTMLFGYGGFNLSLTPTFHPGILPWLENDGVYAVANLRGGSEYGDQWHREGMLENKQNVFDDFISAAQWLIDNKYTRKEKLAIRGRSNGGLLVSACMLQRPDLYGAVICNVPVTDMLRYHKFTIGRYWIPEYGDAENNPEHFKFMYAYSPLHNVKGGVKYPPILIATADTDDRVVPAHPKKLAATLQEKTEGKSKVLLRIESKAGHGHGKPISKLIDEWADFYAFLNEELDI